MEQNSSAPENERPGRGEWQREQGKEYRVASRYGLDLREQPGNGSRLVRTLSNGTTVLADTGKGFSSQDGNAWVHVLVPGNEKGSAAQEGYLKRDYLR